ncbi:hypothetical protein ACFSUS_04430 [Spirosoma soli]|uniref:Uncharacterized protein n=1 Tax=Spirosoma soli TaxID=1770529 RepID=A0ABW5LZY4_9BACT
MQQVINFIGIDQTTLVWLIVLILCAGLFAYANRQLDSINLESTKAGPDQTGLYNWLYRIFYVTYAGGLISLGTLAYIAPTLTIIVSGFVAFLFALKSLNRWLSLAINAAVHRVSQWRWSMSLRSVRLGLLGVGVSTVTFVEEECLLGFMSISPENVIGIISSRLNHAEVWDWANGLVVITEYVLGSALWQASIRLRQENEFLSLAMKTSSYSWRADSLLLTYLALLIGLISTTAFVSLTPVSDYAFWIGYATVLLGQLTPTGQRIGKDLLRRFESLFRSTNHHTL